jgi:hypothetical protein
MREEFLEDKRNQVDKKNSELYAQHRLAEEDLANLSERYALDGIYDVDNMNIFNSSYGAARLAIRLSTNFYKENGDTLHELAITEDKSRNL